MRDDGSRAAAWAAAARDSARDWAEAGEGLVAPCGVGGPEGVRGDWEAGGA